MKVTSTCRVCGGLIQSSIPANWHPSKLASRARRDLKAHMRTHSFAEILRSEIRHDLDQVPDEQRPIIVRDIYRNLLGSMDGSRFVLNDPDGRGVYSIDEALGQVDVYRLWRMAARCYDPNCGCRD
jgi:rRNA maturation protein Nop10